jgi:hypothetical protein
MPLPLPPLLLLLLQVNKVQGEASDMWQKMANADKGSAVHKLYR